MYNLHIEQFQVKATKQIKTCLMTWRELARSCFHNRFCGMQTITSHTGCDRSEPPSLSTTFGIRHH